MKKVLWITDFNADTNLGGSQRTDYFFINEARNRGYHIDYFNHDSERNILSKDYDLVISANLEQMMQKKKKYILHYIFNHRNHIRIEHDANQYLEKTEREKLYASSRLTFFLSEYHYDKFRYDYGQIVAKYDLVMPFIDSSKFYDYELEREDKILYAGYFHPWKGSNNFLEYVLDNPDKQFVVSGWGCSLYCDRIKRVKNLEYIGKTNHDQMPDLYNRYKTIWFHPDRYEPFCRAIGEAMFCGIQLDCSNNIGAIYDSVKYGLELMKHKSSNSPKYLWNKIEMEMSW